MLDAYLWGKVERISPEAPVPVVTVRKKESRLGGAANVALNIMALGAKPIICSAIGDDKEGDEFLEIIQKHNFTSERIIRISGRPTTVKSRVIAHNQHVVRIDSETDKPLKEADTAVLLGKIKELISDQTIDCILFEDYDKGVITPSLIQEVVELANQKNIITVVDPKKRNFLEYKNVTLFKPNLKELKEGLKVNPDQKDKSQLDEAVNKLREVLQAKQVMVTLSEDGVYINSDNGEKVIPAHVRTIADVSGAGDTVIATAALCLAAGLDEFKTAEISNLAGGLVCEHVGAVPIDKQQLLEEAMKL
ncbi:MAG: ADP-heptose synthase, bifunctional sugar kinase/adenylyltransferase [Sphingobacteriaceae bacterium]|nr:ADP-heptose synthase, bifunctional sugar kinase/adenylyltransferase [Sphingobacteriaceae bacterium]